MQLYLDDGLKKYFSTSEDLFDQLMGLRGEVFRHQKGRLTQRVTLGDKNYFIKQHQGVGWKEIIKNIIQLRTPIVDASNEWLAIAKLNALGVHVPRVVAYGSRGINPATRESFILMEELAPTVSLEDLCVNWKKQPPKRALKLALIRDVATIARTLHENGVNHRDFYICHFLKNPQHELYLIDLHRAQIRTKTPDRWMIKDLAGLYFSSKNIGLTNRDLYRFMCVYRQKKLRDIMIAEGDVWRKVKARGEKLYHDHL